MYCKYVPSNRIPAHTAHAFPPRMTSDTKKSGVHNLVRGTLRQWEHGLSNNHMLRIDHSIDSRRTLCEPS